MKRALDVTCAVLGLVVASPLLLVAALGVRATSPGPIIFRQVRIGRDARQFEILKFRSMDSRVESGTNPRLLTVQGDRRVTRVGAVLRTTKIDELPQLWNVLRGDMSLVGPRPEMAKYVELWDPEVRKLILSVRPGVTDPASIAFRRESEMLAAAADPEAYYRDVILPAKAAISADYIRSRSLKSDIRILLSTVLAIVRR